MDAIACCDLVGGIDRDTEEAFLYIVKLIRVVCHGFKCGFTGTNPARSKAANNNVAPGKLVERQIFCVMAFDEIDKRLADSRLPVAVTVCHRLLCRLGHVAPFEPRESP